MFVASVPLHCWGWPFMATFGSPNCPTFSLQTSIDRWSICLMHGWLLASCCCSPEAESGRRVTEGHRLPASPLPSLSRLASRLIFPWYIVIIPSTYCEIGPLVYELAFVWLENKFHLLSAPVVLDFTWSSFSVFRSEIEKQTGKPSTLSTGNGEEPAGLLLPCPWTRSFTSLPSFQ